MNTSGRVGGRVTFGRAVLSLGLAVIAGCGGSGESTTSQTESPSGQPIVTPVPESPTSPVITSGPVYYFSACGAGAQAGCVPGSNSNPGTAPASPRFDLTGLNVNSLPAGTQLHFARGGVWDNFSLQLCNLNVTPTQPLVVDAYSPSWGGTARPWLKSAQTAAYAFEFGEFRQPNNPLSAHGGYVVRNLKLDGQQTRYNSAPAYQGRAFAVRGWARDISLDNLEITGFAFAMISAQTYVEGRGVTEPIVNVVLRNSHIHRNIAMGFLGEAQGLEISGNTFEANNIAPYRSNGPGAEDDEYISTFNHAIYLSGHGRNAVLRNNRFINNSVTDQTDDGVRQCMGGNVTAHGQWDGLLIEGNTITQELSNGSCLGFSITPGGYGTAEYFRGLVLRNNTVVNLGGNAISVGVATNPLIENNLLINLHNRWMGGVGLGAHVSTRGQYGNDIDDGATVRNNTYCTTYGPSNGQMGNVFLSIATERGTSNPLATNVTQSDNVTRTGPEASTGPCAR